MELAVREVCPSIRPSISVHIVEMYHMAGRNKNCFTKTGSHLKSDGRGSNKIQGYAVVLVWGEATNMSCLSVGKH